MQRRNHSARILAIGIGVLGVSLAISGRPFASRWAQTPTAKTKAARAISGELSARIEAYLRPFLQTKNFTGVILVSRGDHVLFQRGYGYADPAFEIPNTPETRFHIASISKAFTAAGVLVLEGRGKLSTVDSVSKFLPDYPNGEKIQLEHLLRHTSGIPNVSEFPEVRLDRYVPYTAASIVATFKDKPLDFDPGTRTRYTNSDYNLLALLIEQASGQDFGEFLRSSILDPLELRSTVHDGDATRIIPRLASGTEPDGLFGVKNVPYLGWSTKTGSGSLVSTTGDLCRFARALFRGEFLNQASLAKIMKPDGVFPYGWTERERSGRKAKAISGRSPGFISNVEYFLDDGTCVAILTNSYSEVGQTIAADISALALGQRVTPPRIRYVRPAPGQLRAFTGRFQMPENYYAPNATLTIQDRGEYLEATWSVGFVSVIYPAGGDDFVDRANWAMVQFNRDKQGQITGFTYKLLQVFNARKIPVP